MTLIPLSSQKHEVLRELAERAGTERGSRPDRRAHMQAVAQTLGWALKHQVPIECFWKDRGEPMPVLPPDAASSEERPGRVTIEAQIIEVRQTLSDRRMAYDARVSRSRMRQSEADLLQARLASVLQTLEWCRDHRPAAEAYFLAKRDAA